MKKFQKLLVLSFSALLSVGVIAGCNNPTPSSPAESTPAPESSTVESTPTESESSTPVETADLAAEAKVFLEETYKDTTSVMADFTLPTTHLMYDENDAQVTLNIAWELEVAAGGVEGAIVKGTAADGKQPFTVKYNAADSSVATTFTITGTITDPNGHEATVTFNWSVPKFEFASFDDFKQAVADKSTEVVNVRGHVIAIYKDGLYLEDANGDGFYAYRPTDFAIDKYSVGDEILVSGTATSYSSQYEFNSGCTVQLLNEASADFAPVYEDVTSIFQAAANNKDTALDAHQNSLVTVKGVTVDTYSNEKDSSLYYYFTIGNVRTYLRPYSGWVNPNTGAAFTMDEINALVSEWVKGYTADLKGILSIYGGAYYLSLIDDDAITYTSKELPDDAKAANAAEAAAASFKEVYVMGHTFDLPTTGQSEASLAYSVVEGSAASINSDGDLVVSPAAADSTVKVEIAATVGVETAKYTVDFTVKGSTYETIDAAKALEIAQGLGQGKYSDGWHYVSAVVGEVYNDQYCNFYLPVGDDADALTVYGLWTGQDSGENRYGSKREIAEIPVKAGDKVVLYTQFQHYYNSKTETSSYQLANAMLIDVVRPGLVWSGATAGEFTANEDGTYSAEITLKLWNSIVFTYTDAEYNKKVLTHANTTMEGYFLASGVYAADWTPNLYHDSAAGEAAGQFFCCVNEHTYAATYDPANNKLTLADPKVEEETPAGSLLTDGATLTFDLGENGEAAHKDGTDLGAENTITSGDVSIALTNISKVYGSATDLTGKSALKLGTSSKVGTFTMTVDESVDYVVFYVAGYKANDCVVDINGTVTTVTTHSSDGEYTEIRVDTTTTKTIVFSTTADGKRAMIDSIVLGNNAE